MPIHLLVLFLLFIMSNLFYRGGGGAGSNLSILKEAKKNYMGRFMGRFSRGWGSICLFLSQNNAQYFGGYIKYYGNYYTV